MTLPANLYAYTDSSVTGTTYYAWTYNSYSYYTLSETPAAYSQLYAYENGAMVTADPLEELREYDSATVPPRIRVVNDGGGGSAYYDRDTANDVTIYTNPQTVYTASTTLTVGQSLYDDEGSTISYTIDTINQDGSFTITSSQS